MDPVIIFWAVALETGAEVVLAIIVECVGHERLDDVVVGLDVDRAALALLLVRRSADLRGKAPGRHEDGVAAGAVRLEARDEVTNVSFAAGPLHARATRELRVLEGLTGALRAGTATLIIANAGGGKLTLLELVAARRAASEGRVLWNGLAPGAGAARPPKVAAVAPQVDVHEPLLTVCETLEFAAACCVATHGAAEASEAERALRARLVDHVIDTLGLRECRRASVALQTRPGARKWAA